MYVPLNFNNITLDLTCGVLAWSVGSHRVVTLPGGIINKNLHFKRHLAVFKSFHKRLYMYVVFVFLCIGTPQNCTTLYYQPVQMNLWCSVVRKMFEILWVIISFTQFQQWWSNLHCMYVHVHKNSMNFSSISNCELQCCTCTLVYQLYYDIHV